MKFKAYRINGETFEQDKKPFLSSNSYAEIQQKLLDDKYAFKCNERLKTARGIYVKTIKIHKEYCECFDDFCDCPIVETLVIINEVKE